jgi:putative FmdB family regulatory protein
MPTYEYYCLSCGFEFEEFQSIASEPISECPKCDQHVERKISGGAGLIFKGTGFYITDYKKTNSSPESPNNSKTQKTKKQEKIKDSTNKI